MDIAVILDIGLYWSCDQGHLFASLHHTRNSWEGFTKKIGSDWPKCLREEHDNMQNFGPGPTISMGQCFGENLVIFCKLST